MNGKKNNKKLIKITICILAIFLSVFGAFIAGQIVTIKQIGRAAFTNEQIYIEETWENPYKDLIKDEVSFYIIETCKSLNFDSDIVVSILLEENPEQNFYTLNKNNNGSVDCGLFQLNSKYITYFANKYWAFDKFSDLEEDLEFDVFNWQHNTWMAIHLLKDLYDSFDKDIGKMAMAYNAGISKVLNNNIPETTKVYKTEVLNNYKMLKN